MTVSYHHVVFASLVSAVAWVDAWLNRKFRGASYDKAYLLTERDAVLAHPAMIGALRDAQMGKPDEGSTKKRYYHNWKDIIPTYLETARDLFGKEEMPSKYLSFCGVTGGLGVGAVIGFVVGVSVVLVAVE
jgi:hypothetical protein